MIKLGDLKKVKYFNNLDDEHLASLAARMMEKKLSRGENIIFEGMKCTGFYLVKSGRIKVSRTSKEGREHIFYYAYPGDAVCDFSIFLEENSPLSASATVKSVVYYIGKQDLLNLIKNIPDLSMILIKHLSQRLKLFADIVEDLSFKNVPSRLAKILVDMVEREGVKQGDNVLLKRNITLYEMASMVGTVREVITRSLQKLEKDGVLNISRREIEIVDLEKLKRIAQVH